MQLKLSRGPRTSYTFLLSASIIATCPAHRSLIDFTNTRWPVKPTEALVMWHPKLFAYLCANILLSILFSNTCNFSKKPHSWNSETNLKSYTCVYLPYPDGAATGRHGFDTTCLPWASIKLIILPQCVLGEAVMHMVYVHDTCMPRHRNSFPVTQACHTCRKYHFLYVSFLPIQ
jgi:hypothetical protein